MDIDRDAGLPVERGYVDRSLSEFSGKIHKVVFNINPHLAEADRQAIHEHAQPAALAHGIGA